MKTAIVILSIIDFIAIGSTLICGFWIRTQMGDKPDPSSLNFHGGLALITCLLVVVTLILAMIRK